MGNAPHIAWGCQPMTNAVGLSYSRAMATNGTENPNPLSGQRRVQAMSQAEWDEENRLAEVRRGRAKLILVPDLEDSSESPAADSHGGDGAFIGGTELLRRIGTLQLLKRNPEDVPQTTKSKADTVDWSECVAHPVAETPQGVPTATSFADLADREIELRGRVAFEDEPRPRSMAHIRRSTQR